MTLAESIRDVIRQRELSCYSLAKDTGIHSTQLQRFMKAERGLSLDGLEKLVEVLELVLVEKKTTKKTTPTRKDR